MTINKQYKVLLVDDEKDNLNAFIRVFEEYFDLLPAGSGKEALEILKQEPTIGLVVADQRMDGMSGVELLEQIKILYPEKVRMVLTGYSDFQVPIDAINKGDVFRYLQKPVEKESTLEALSEGLAKYEKALQGKQKMEDAKKQIQDRFLQIYESLAAGVTHHVNNGLVPAKTFLSLLTEKLKDFKNEPYDAAFFETFLAEALSSLDKVQHLTQMLLWAHHSDMAAFSNVKTAELINENHPDLKKLFEIKKIKFEKTLPSHLSDVMVDKDKVEEMLHMLLKNCAAAAPQGSLLRLKAEEKELQDQTKVVRVQVTYQGKGYTEEEIPRLFDPFYRFDEKLGTNVNGLELTNCFIIATKHGCSLKVKSEPGKETSFIVDLPVAPSLS